MKQLRYLLLLLLACNAFPLFAQLKTEVVQIGEDIQLIRLTDNTIIHRSFRQMEEYGRVPANGLIYIVDSMCLIFDTPFTVKTTTRLMDYLTEDMGLSIQGVVINHFHEDCMAGIDSVHARSIPTYAYKRTLALATAEGLTAPTQKFGKRKRLKIGEQEVINYYPGPAHSPDNIVSYIPAEGVLFGGCMLKAMNAGKGNLADASVDRWSKSIRKVKKQFPEAKTLVPGHGRQGGPELLDYTIQLFEPETAQK
jgi:metallo-beta-lactamase class B